MTPGERIRFLRLIQGMTQKTLCDVLGIVPPHLARYESGKVSIPVRLVSKFSEALGTRPGWISYGEGTPFTFLIGTPAEKDASGHAVSTVLKGLSSGLLTNFRQETAVRHTVKVELVDSVVYALAGDSFLLLIIAFKPVSQVLSRCAGQGMETVSVVGATAARIAEGEGRKDLLKILSALSKKVLPLNVKGLADMWERRFVFMTSRTEWPITLMVKSGERMTREDAERVLLNSIDLNRLPTRLEIVISIIK